MANIKPVIISTMGDMAEHGYYISIHYESCNRWRDIDPQKWLDQGLPDVEYTQAEFKCEDCGKCGKKQVRSVETDLMGHITKH